MSESNNEKHKRKLKLPKCKDYKSTRRSQKLFTYAAFVEEVRNIEAKEIMDSYNKENLAKTKKYAKVMQR